MSLLTRSLTGLLAAAVLTLPAAAAVITFDIDANGVKEVNAAGDPNKGDLDATGIGTLTLDNVAGTATFSITLSNINVPLGGFHVHRAPATTNGPIVLDFGSAESFRVGDLLSGTVSNLSTATITEVFGNPANFYFNLHNPQFPGGAVRDQLGEVPEPSSFILAGLGLATAALLRRRK